MTLVLAACGLAIAGVAINAWFAHSLGASEVGSWLLMAIGVTTDMAAVTSRFGIHHGTLRSNDGRVTRPARANVLSAMFTLANPITRGHSKHLDPSILGKIPPNTLILPFWLKSTGQKP
jgi:hypothetical protein